MPAFKTRRVLLAQGGLQVGPSGTSFAQVLSGTVAACVPAMGASALGTGSAAISGIAASGMLLMQLNSGGSGLQLTAVCPISANTASLSFMSLGATAASTVTLSYIYLGS